MSHRALWIAWCFALPMTGCSACVNGDFVDPPAVDATDPEPDAVFCIDAWTVAPEHFDPCEIPAPSAPLVLDKPGRYTFTTGPGAGAGLLVDPQGALLDVAQQVLAINGADTHLISIRSLVIESGTTLRVIGPLGLLVASWSTLDVDGVIDASSSMDETGAGTRTGCASVLPMQGTNSGGNSGGGGGGGYGSPGSQGGDATGALGGAAGNMIETPTTIQGGCPGGRAGGASGIIQGGAGGGAIQLTAARAVTVSGTIHAGGEGGRGGPVGQVGAGAGGGSGGFIGLDSPAVLINGDARLAANGGGGGSGYNTATPGVHGQPGIASGSPARGGDGTDDGGPGGDGGAVGVETGSGGINAPVTDTSAAGGGGGGVGHIVLGTGTVTIEPTATVSPTSK